MNEHSTPDSAHDDPQAAGIAADAPADAPPAEPPLDEQQDSANAAAASPEPGAKTHHSPHRFSFMGEGGELFGIYVVGLLLSALSLSLYYPWFRAALLRFLYEKTEFLGSRWSFIGSGREMFVGYIKFLVLIGTIYGLYFGGVFWSQSGGLGAGSALVMLAGIGFLLLVPLAVHGALRYRLSRSVWRGIHAGYVGKFGDLFGSMVGGLMLSNITAGIYYPWFQADIGRYIISNLRLGSLRARFTGVGSDISGAYFRYWAALAALFISTVAFFATVAIQRSQGNELDDITSAGIVTLLFFFFVALGILAWLHLRAKTLNWFVNKSELINDADGQRYRLKGEFTPGKVFGLAAVNTLMLAVTFGLAYPWVIVRNIEFMYQNIAVDGSFDPSTIVQTQAPEADATGEGLFDYFDIGIA